MYMRDAEEANTYIWRAIWQQVPLVIILALIVLVAISVTTWLLRLTVKCTMSSALCTRNDCEQNRMGERCSEKSCDVHDDRHLWRIAMPCKICLKSMCFDNAKTAVALCHTFLHYTMDSCAQSWPIRSSCTKQKKNRVHNSADLQIICGCSLHAQGYTLLASYW